MILVLSSMQTTHLVVSARQAGEMKGIFHSVMERPFLFNAVQRAFPFTVLKYRNLLRDFVQITPDQSILDIGCGIGAHRPYLRGRYTGIDINPLYIKRAQQTYEEGEFLVMDCETLDIGERRFDHIVTIAAFHHISDIGVKITLEEGFRALKARGSVHIVDAIYPINPMHRFKKWIFAQDRGQYQRHIDELAELLGSIGTIEKRHVLVGFPHDVAYFELKPN
jgi:ubiquinone/menaquinone biosynthesis C-methylase UbiE